MSSVSYNSPARFIRHHHKSVVFVENINLNLPAVEIYEKVVEGTQDCRIIVFYSLCKLAQKILPGTFSLSVVAGLRWTNNF